MALLQTDPKRLWVRYLFAVSLIVILISSEQIIALTTAQENPGLASAINVGGRQRMLSQRILYLASQAHSDKTNTSVRGALLSDVILFEESHRKLSVGVKENFNFENPEALNRLYFDAEANGGPSLDQIVNRFVSDTLTIIEKTDESSDQAWARLQEVGPKILLSKLDEAVRLIEQESRASADFNLLVRNTSYILALTVLLLELLLIFWPAHRTILSSLNNLEETQRKTEELLAETEAARTDAAIASQAKSDFLATMSHEVRTPINGVLGIANVLLTEDIPPKTREKIRLIQESGDHLMQILNDILDLSKIEANKLEIEQTSFSLKRSLEFARAIWESRFQASGLTFSMEYALEGVDMIVCDKTRLRQVLFNLLSNAGKFTKTGEISLRASIERDHVPPMLRFEVTDTGIGMDPNQIDKLFKPFEQADNSSTRGYGGTGLGLAICHRLVGMLGGEIGATSTLGEGSTFWFTVALSESDEAAEELVDLSSENVTALVTKEGRSVQILAAEDNEINQMVLTSLLSPLGCQVEIVADGEQALRATSNKDYDIILMDIQMPNMDGVEATMNIRSLKNGASETPIVALTASAMPGDRQRYLAAGMNDYVTKPIDPRELYAAITRNLGSKLAQPAALQIMPPSIDPETQLEKSQKPSSSSDEVPSDIKNLLAALDNLSEKS